MICCAWVHKKMGRRITRPKQGLNGAGTWRGVADQIRSPYRECRKANPLPSKKILACMHHRGVVALLAMHDVAD